MIISSLRLRDFLVHEDSEIEFKEGLNVITGENGSGKSSIIQAIYYALFGKSLYYDNVKQFLRFNKNDFYVKLEFNTNGGKFFIERSLKGYFKTNKYNIPNSTTLKEYLFKNYRINEKRYLNTLLVKQGSLNQFILLSKKERLEEFERILGIDVMKMISEKSKEMARDCEKLYKQYNEQEIRNKIDELKKEIEQLLNEKQESENKLKELRVKKGSLESDIQNLRNIKDLIRKIEEIGEKEKQLKEIEKFLNENSENYQTYEKFQEIYKDALRTKEAKSKLEELENKLKEIERFKEGHDKYKTYLEWSEREDIKDLESACKQGKKLGDEIEKVFNTREIGEIEKIIKDCESKENQLKEKNDENRKKLGEIKAKIEQNQKILKEIESIKGKCPICKRDLDEEHKLRLKKEASEEIEKLREEEKRLNNEIKDIENELKNIRRFLDKKDIFLRYKQIKESFDMNLWKEWKEKKEYSQYKSYYDNYKQKDALEKEFQKYENIVKSWNYPFDFNEVISYVESDENKMFYQNYVKKQSEKERLEKEISKKQELENNLNNLTQKFKDIDFNNLDNLIGEKQKELDNLNQEIGKFEERIRNCEKSIKEKKEQLREKEKEIEKIENLKENYKFYWNLYEKLEKVINYKRKRYYENLSAFVSYYFDKFGLEDYREVKIGFENGLNIYLCREDGSEVEAYNLSGGEQASLSLALRLAIAQLLDLKFKILILDEPTYGMDNIRVKSLGELFLNFIRNNPDYQVILVTHEEEIFDIPDIHRIHLEKRNGRSFIETYAL